MKKRDKILIIVGIAIIFVFVTLKAATINQYMIPSYYWDPYNVFKNTWTIRVHEEKNLLDFQGLKFKNYFTGFKTHNFNEMNIKYDKQNNPVAGYSVQFYPQYNRVLNEHAFELYSEGDDIPDYTTGKSMQKYLDRNHIKDDIDLIKHIKYNYYFSSNILTPVSTIKNYSILNTLATLSILDGREFILIDGDLNGYIKVYKDNPFIKEIHLLVGDFQFVITLNGEEITTDEFIKALLQSVQFEFEEQENK